jgi:hypothetical protein
LPWFIGGPRDARHHRLANAAIRVEIETRQEHELLLANQAFIAPAALNVGTALGSDVTVMRAGPVGIMFGLDTELRRYLERVNRIETRKVTGLEIVVSRVPRIRARWGDFEPTSTIKARAGRHPRRRLHR